EFARGATALQLLAIGQLFSVAAGPLGAALIMQQRERAVLATELFAIGCGVIVAIMLIPTWGMTGAAAGLLCSDVLRNVINGFSVWAAKP
ncbi:MAG: hypothetical protein HC870_00940, partial [Rhizobiales bacterium]|nr:hypothetical protein [Hyphomicrobiales bacterium]